MNLPACVRSPFDGCFLPPDWYKANCLSRFSQFGIDIHTSLQNFVNFCSTYLTGGFFFKLYTFLRLHSFWFGFNYSNASHGWV